MLDFISNLYRRNDRPLARESGLTRIIEELPADNPAMALEELTPRLRDLSEAADISLQERMKRVARIDKSARQYERALRRQYTDASRMSQAVEERIWHASFDFLQASSNAYLKCVENPPQKAAYNDQELALAIMRAMRRLELQAHWLHLRYQPLSPALWQRIFSVIEFAEAHALLHCPLALNSASKGQTTIAREMLKLLMMSVATPERLTKTQIDLAHALTHSLAATFCWEQIPQGSTAFHMDFSKPRTPLRLAQVSEHLFMSRCFGPGDALPALVAGLKKLAQGGVPETLGTLDCARYKREDLQAVVAHLSQCWSPMGVRAEQLHCDKRHAERTQVFYRISVVHGFNQLAQPALQAPAPCATLGSAQEQDAAESWVVENISRMGYGVTIASRKEDWVQSQTLIGIQSDAAPWRVGVIRRVASASAEDTQAGIQILSNRPQAAMLRPLDAELRIGETTRLDQHTPGIFMPKEPPYQDEASLLLVSGSYQLHRIYAMMIGAEQRTVRLLDRISRFQGVDQVIFAEVKAIA